MSVNIEDKGQMEEMFSDADSRSIIILVNIAGLYCKKFCELISKTGKKTIPFEIGSFICQKDLIKH